jgi:uncharacterized protein YggE
MSMRRALPILAALLLAAAAATACTWQAGASSGTQRTFSVSGHGEARSAPDIAMVSTGVRTQGATAKEALQRNTAAMTGVFKAMKEMGIADKDMQTSNFSVQPIYEPYREGQPNQQRIVAYQVFNQVTVTVRDLARLGEALDTFVSAGSNELQGVNFSIDKPEPLQDEAREAAIREALHKAELMAKAAGVKLGRLVTMAESGGGRPMPAMAMSMRAEKADVPIAAGEQLLAADVSLTFEIK